MPIVQVHLLEGKTQEQKRKMVAKVTEVICETLGCTPDKVRIILSDMNKGDYSVAGKLALDN